MVLIAFGEAEANSLTGRQRGASSNHPGARETEEVPLETGLLPLAAPRPHQERRHGAQSCALNM